MKWFVRSLVFFASFIVLLIPLSVSSRDNLFGTPVQAATSVPSARAANVRGPSKVHTSPVQLRKSSIPIKAPSPKLVPKKPSVPTVELGSTGNTAEWVNEALAELGYLPVSFVDGDGLSAFAVRTSLAASITSGTPTPYSGTWVWSVASPPTLVALWNPTTSNRLTQGAIMAFESAHHLTVDGIAGPQVYSALQTALREDEASTVPYTYVTVTKSSPETLQVWQNGKIVLTSLANTGILASPTPNGTWPVYERLQSQDMKGTNPDGTQYDDPDVPYVSYFYKGCAIHGFERASYGSPQSLGCVELPVQTASDVYSLLQYGTLVTVQSSAS